MQPALSAAWGTAGSQGQGTGSLDTPVSPSPAMVTDLQHWPCSNDDIPSHKKSLPETNLVLVKDLPQIQPPVPCEVWRAGEQLDLGDLGPFPALSEGPAGPC